MADGKNKITYTYEDGKFSRKAVIHAFKYLSALTGICFEPAERHPDVIFGSRDSSVFGGTAIDSESVDWIIEAISFDGNRVHSDTGIRLSMMVTRLVENLRASKFISSDRQAINIWPAGRKFGSVVTHDMDIARRSISGSLRLLLESDPKGGLRGLVDSLKSFLGGRPNPYNRVPQWIELEDSLGIADSTYFIFAGDRHYPEDPKYELGDIADSLTRLVERGFEIALHSGIGYQDGNGLDDCKLSLEQFTGREISGVRPHYLKVNLPRYWRNAEAAGLSYSSCLGFDDRAGYFNGIDLPFVPFDKEKDSPLEIVEIPITLMDCGIIGRDDAASAETAARGEDIIDGAADSGGIIVFDWHQRTLYDADYPGWGELYSHLIRHAMAKDAYFCSMSYMSSLLKNRMSVGP